MHMLPFGVRGKLLAFVKRALDNITDPPVGSPFMDSRQTPERKLRASMRTDFTAHLWY